MELDQIQYSNSQSEGKKHNFVPFFKKEKILNFVYRMNGELSAEISQIWLM